MTIPPDADYAVMRWLEEEQPDLTYGKTIFTGEELAPLKNQIPQRAVFVLASGGSAPIFCRGQTGDAWDRSPLVQIITRGDREDFEGSRGLAYRVARSVRTFPSKRFDGVPGLFPQQSDPVYVGRNANGNPIWSQNAVVLIDNTQGD